MTPLLSLTPKPPISPRNTHAKIIAHAKTEIRIVNTPKSYLNTLAQNAVVFSGVPMFQTPNKYLFYRIFQNSNR